MSEFYLKASALRLYSDLLLRRFNAGEETWNLVYSEWDSFLENKTYWAG